jgi:hypothetical protein
MAEKVDNYIAKLIDPDSIPVEFDLANTSRVLLIVWEGHREGARQDIRLERSVGDHHNLDPVADSVYGCNDFGICS